MNRRSKTSKSHKHDGDKNPSSRSAPALNSRNAESGNNDQSNTPQKGKKGGGKGFAGRPPDVTDSDWELMKWRNPEKYGKPEFAEGETRPDEDKEFVFPRYFHHGAEWNIATHETASHWLTAEETYKSKFMSTQNIQQRAVDRGNMQSRWDEERLEDKDHKFGVSKHGVPVKMGGQGQAPEASVTRLEVWRDPSGKLKESHKELTPNKKKHGRDDDPSNKGGSKDSIHSIEDPYYYGDPYVEDPSKYFREKHKLKTRSKRRNRSPEPSTSDGDDDDGDPSKRKRKGSSEGKPSKDGKPDNDRRPSSDRDKDGKKKKHGGHKPPTGSDKSPPKSKSSLDDKPPSKNRKSPDGNSSDGNSSDDNPGDGDGKPGDGDGTPGDGDGDGKPEDGDGDGKPGDGKPRDGDGKPGHGNGKPGDGDGTPTDGNSTDGNSTDSKTNGSKSSSSGSGTGTPPLGNGTGRPSSSRKPSWPGKGKPPTSGKPRTKRPPGGKKGGRGPPFNRKGPPGTSSHPGGRPGQGSPTNNNGKPPLSSTPGFPGNNRNGSYDPNNPFGKTPHGPGNDNDVNYDYIYFNARRACTLPPKRAVPAYVDDPKGTRHPYSPSGLACFYVNKSDYGKIPNYLKAINRELGRPEEPDLRRFYKPHVSSYYSGQPEGRVWYRPKTAWGTYDVDPGACMQNGGYGGWGGNVYSTNHRGQKGQAEWTFPNFGGDCQRCCCCLVNSKGEVVGKASVPIITGAWADPLEEEVPQPPQECEDEDPWDNSMESGDQQQQSRLSSQNRRQRRSTDRENCREPPNTDDVFSNQRADTHRQSTDNERYAQRISFDCGSDSDQARRTDFRNDRGREKYSGNVGFPEAQIKHDDCDNDDLDIQHIHHHHNGYGGFGYESDFDPELDVQHYYC